jgi:hypothetical protein
MVNVRLTDDIYYFAHMIDVHRSLLPFWHASAVGADLRSDGEYSLHNQGFTPKPVFRVVNNDLTFDM